MQNFYQKAGIALILALALTGCKTRSVAIQPVSEAQSLYPVVDPIITPTTAQVGFEKFKAEVKMSGLGVGGCNLEFDQGLTFTKNNKSASIAALKNVFSSLSVLDENSSQSALAKTQPFVRLTVVQSSTLINADSDFSSKFNGVTDVIMKLEIISKDHPLVEKEISGQHKCSRNIGSDNVAASLFIGGILGGMALQEKCSIWQNWIQESIGSAYRSALDETKRYLIESQGIIEKKIAT